MRSFLYALGLPLSLFACSALLLISSKQIQKGILQIFCKYGGVIFSLSSIFQFIWIFWSQTDLSKTTYYLSILLISVIVTVLYYNVIINYKAIFHNHIITKVSYVTRPLFKFLINDIEDKGLIKESKKEEFVIEREKVMKNMAKKI